MGIEPPSAQPSDDGQLAPETSTDQEHQDAGQPPQFDSIRDWLETFGPPDGDPLPVVYAYVGLAEGTYSRVSTLCRAGSGNRQLDLYWCGRCGGYWIAFTVFPPRLTDRHSPPRLRLPDFSFRVGMKVIKEPPFRSSHVDEQRLYDKWSERWSRIADAEQMRPCACASPPGAAPNSVARAIEGTRPTVSQPATAPPAITPSEFEDLLDRFLPELRDNRRAEENHDDDDDW